MRWLLICAAGAALAITGCDNGPSAIETRARDAADVTPAAGAVDPSAGDPAPASRRAIRPRWSSTSRYTAEENAERAFARNGAALEAQSVEDYVARAHAFIADPPRGTQTLRRANGDTLYYHEASNTFAVATRDGAPRTLFKPDEGAAYWTEQQAREASRGSSG